MYCRGRTYFNEELKIWSGEKVPSIYNENASIGQIIFASFRKYPNNTAQISDDDGSKYTNKEMEKQIVQVIRKLTKLQFKKDDVIGIISRNNSKVGAIVIAALTIGMPLNSIDPSLTKVEWKRILCISKPKLIVCETDCYENVNEIIKEINSEATILIFNHSKRFENVQSSDILFEKDNADDDESYFIPPTIEGLTTIAVLACTSGTTGPSKCVGMSHSTIIRNFTNFQPFIRCDIGLCFSNLFWLSGLISLVSASMIGCTRIITTKSFSPKFGLQLIEKYKVSLLMSSSYQMSEYLLCSDINNFNLSSIRMYVIAGGTVNRNHFKKMQSYVKHGEMLNFYGFTEFGMISKNLCEPNETNNSSVVNTTVGQIIENVMVKILNENQQQVGINEMGEICTCRKDYKFLGYYNSDGIQNSNIIDEDGWLHSGDLGYIDRFGDLHIQGRLKDIIKYKGYQISPMEIEEIIFGFSSDILGVSVIGIPDGIGNDLPAAFIIKKSNSNIMEKEIYDYVSENISNPKLLRGGIYFLNEFPLTPSGKVKRLELQDYGIKMFSKIAARPIDD